MYQAGSVDLPLVEDPADPTTLAQWSVRLGVSTRTLTRVFRTETGSAFDRWVCRPDAIAERLHPLVGWLGNPY